MDDTLLKMVRWGPLRPCTLSSLFMARHSSLAGVLITPPLISS